MESLHEKIVDRLANAFNHPHAKSNDEDKLNQLFNNTACTIIEDLQEILGILPSSSSPHQDSGSSPSSSSGWLLLSIWTTPSETYPKPIRTFLTHAAANAAMQTEFDKTTKKYADNIDEQDDSNASNFYYRTVDDQRMEWYILELKS